LQQGSKGRNGLGMGKAEVGVIATSFNAIIGGFDKINQQRYGNAHLQAIVVSRRPFSQVLIAESISPNLFNSSPVKNDAKSISASTNP
jgi:hypothetical protein